MICARCGSTAHTLVGGECLNCWTDDQDQSAPIIRRVAATVHTDIETRQVA